MTDTHRGRLVRERKQPLRVRPRIRRSAWTTLKVPQFRLYFAGSLISNLGTWLQNTAQVLLAYHLTHSVFVVGLVTCVQFSGFLFLGPLAAVAADRVGGKSMLIATQLASAGMAGALAGLQALGLLSEQVLVLGALGLGLAFTFALPVQTAMVPQLVSDSDTDTAMAINSVSYNAGRAVAPLLCVIVVATTGYAWAFALNAISFVIFAGTLTRTHARSIRRPSRRVRVWDGIKVARCQPRIALMLAMVAAVTFADDPILVLGPALARHFAGISIDLAPLFLSALGTGTVLGSFWPMRDPAGWDESFTSKRAAKYLLLLVGAIFVFSLDLNPGLCLLAAFVAGVAALGTGAVTQSQLVRRSPESVASVMALWAIAWAGTKPLASFLDGSLASMLGVRWAGVLLATPAMLLAAAELCLPHTFRNRIRKAANRAAKPVRMSLAIERT